MFVAININDKVFQETSAFLKKGILEPAQNLVKRIAGYAENRMGLNADKIVYSYVPRTPKFTRTGRLLGGRGSSLSGGFPARTEVSNLEIHLEANPQLKGARFNYAPSVNDGTGAMRGVGPRPFFDVTVKETRSQAPTLAAEVLDDYLGKSIFG